MLRKFETWAKTDCDECGCEYQVTRTEPKERRRPTVMQSALSGLLCGVLEEL